LVLQGYPVFWTGSVPSGSMLRRAMHKWGVTVVVASGLAAGAAVLARTPAAPAGLPQVAMATLPAEAQATHRRILNGGPFPYEKDGSVFGNRERLLPPRARGHYREYTVETPGARNRGARRIVCGGSPPNRPETCYFTGDHYASFSRIAQ
jgi:ribonuclease T1